MAGALAFAAPASAPDAHKPKLTHRREGSACTRAVDVPLSVLFEYVRDKLAQTFLSPGSLFSLSSLACALCVAAGFLAWRRLRRRRRLRPRALLRALFPRRFWRSRSSAADVGYFLLGTFVFGVLFGWALLSYQLLSNGVVAQLTALFGVRQASAAPELAVRAAMTLALFLAYEFAYWLDHFLSHRLPFLWEFHKVHHQAEVLTPLTVFRIHPVDGLVHANITALVLGCVNGVMSYMFGRTAYQYAFADTNLILVLFVHAYVHLQHTHMWIAFRGLAGHLLLSPAHHQIHHSTDPAHFNKNLGSCLAVWDWLFGTLHVPEKQPEKLRFGVDEPAETPRGDPHAVAASVVRPFAAAVARLKPAVPRAIPDAASNGAPQ